VDSSRSRKYAGGGGDLRGTQGSPGSARQNPVKRSSAKPSADDTAEQSSQRVPTVRPRARSDSDADFSDQSDVYPRAPRTPSTTFPSPASAYGVGFDAKLSWAERRLAAGVGGPRLKSLCSVAALRRDDVLLDSVIDELLRS
jgi:hypothetical protein